MARHRLEVRRCCGSKPVPLNPISKISTIKHEQALTLDQSIEEVSSTLGILMPILLHCDDARVLGCDAPIGVCDVPFDVCQARWWLSMR
jgi:hypothetical protein